jgi:hypothetical protein
MKGGALLYDGRCSPYRIVTEIFSCTLLLFLFFVLLFSFSFCAHCSAVPWVTFIDFTPADYQHTPLLYVSFFLSLFRPCCCPLMPAIHSCLSYIFISSRYFFFVFFFSFFFLLHASHQLDKLDSRHTHAFNRWQKALFSFFLHIPLFFLFSFHFSFFLYCFWRLSIRSSDISICCRPSFTLVVRTVWRRVDCWETLCRGVARHGCR